METTNQHVDVLIVGAGLSGIGAGYHLQQNCPGKSYVILEGRETIGGTWDLFRYPGIRSDSDMFTLGYAFKPWVGAKAIADGPSILKYVRDTAVARGLVDRGCLLDHRGRTHRAGGQRQSPGRPTRNRAPALQLPVHVQRLLPL